MPSIIDFSQLTFGRDQIRDMNELVVEKVLEAPLLNTFTTFYTGIKNDREIGKIAASFGLIGKAAQGCNPVADVKHLAITPKLWSPKRIEVILDECAADLENSIAKFARNCGIDVNDLTGTEYFAYLLDVLQKDIISMIFRYSWFGDTAAALWNASPAGKLTTGVDPAYFNVLDGYWKQLAAIYAADPLRRTTLAANAEATRALQFSTLTPALALAALNQLVDDAPEVLAEQPDQIILTTKSIAQKAMRELQRLGTPFKIELQTSGIQLTEWDGIQMMVLPMWDYLIKAYQNNGTKLNSPHRALLTTKSNLAIGMECTSLFDRINSFYDQKSRINRMEASDAFDMKILNDKIVQVLI